GRPGTSGRGAWPVLSTACVEGADQSAPIADHVRSTLDGHLWLSRELAHERHFPSIDVLASVSRLMSRLVTSGHQRQAARILEALSTYRRMRDLIAVGAYTPGTQPEVDHAPHLLPRITAFLHQAPDDFAPWEVTQAGLQAILEE